MGGRANYCSACALGRTLSMAEKLIMIQLHIKCGKRQSGKITILLYLKVPHHLPQLAHPTLPLSPYQPIVYTIYTTVK